MGPSIRACTGQSAILSFLQPSWVISATARKRKGGRAKNGRGVHMLWVGFMPRARRAGLWRAARIVAAARIADVGAVRRLARSGRGRRRARRAELEREQAVALERAGQPQRAGLLAREAEAAVIGRIADQDDRAVAEPACLAQARGAPAPRRCRGCGNRRRPPRPEQQRALAAWRKRRATAARCRRRACASAAMNEGRRAGSRPSRSRSEVLRRRVSPKASSSSASRAAMSAGRS